MLTLCGWEVCHDEDDAGALAGEVAKRPEQLRALQDGMRIVVGEVDTAARGIDTMQDYRLLTLAPRRSSQ